MAASDVKLPSSTVANPILLWLIQNGWEEPGWGRMPINQVVIGLMLNDIGDKLTDPALKEQVRHIAQTVVGANASRLVK